MICRVKLFFFVQREKLDVSLQLALAKAQKVTMDIMLDHQTFTSAAR